MQSFTFVCFAKKKIYIMLKINILDNTKYSQIHKGICKHAPCLVMRQSHIKFGKMITVKQRTSKMAAWGRLAVKIIFNNNNVQGI